jgi:hypothetical protein
MTTALRGAGRCGTGGAGRRSRRCRGGRGDPIEQGFNDEGQTILKEFYAPDDFPELGSDLVTALTSLNVDNFSHEFSNKK